MSDFADYNEDIEPFDEDDWHRPGWVDPAADDAFLRNTGNDRWDSFMSRYGEGRAVDYLSDAYASLQQEARPIEQAFFLRPEGVSKFGTQTRGAGGRFGGGLFSYSEEARAAIAEAIEEVLKESLVENYDRLFPESQGGLGRGDVIKESLEEGEVRITTPFTPKYQSDDSIQIIYIPKDLPTEPWSTGEYHQSNPPDTIPLMNWLFFGHRAAIPAGEKPMRFFSMAEDHWVTLDLVPATEGKNIFDLTPEQKTRLMAVIAKGYKGILAEGVASVLSEQ